MHNWGRVPAVHLFNIIKTEFKFLYKGCWKMEMFLKLVGVIIIAIGVVSIYDARKITNKFFSTSDINTVTQKLKIAGFAVALIGGILVILAK